MFQDWIHRLPSRLHIVIATGISLIVSAAFGVALGEGNLFKVYLWLLGAGIVALIMVLGDKYWMLIPFAYTCDLPAIPIKGKLVELPEITALVCSVVFFVRYALRKQTFTLFRAIHIPVLLYAGWAGFIYFQNPVGLSEFGSGEGGGRNYAKIAMGLAVFMVIANQQIGAREAKVILILVLIGSFFATAKEIFFYFVPMQSGAMLPSSDPEAYYTWHQSLANIPLVTLLLIFSRYPAREIFSLRSMWMIPVFVLCLVIILLSGKRTAVAVLPLYAIMAAFYRKEYGFLTAWLTGAVVMAAIVVVGHGTLFRLPITAQRAVSWLPGKWDGELESYRGGGDEFRKMLRTLAKEKVKLDPWIGTGYKIDRSLIHRIHNSGPGGIESQVAPYALGSAWHNTWYGYAADFGIPASILIAVIYITYLTRGVRTFNRAPANTYLQVLTLYIVLFTTRDFAFTHISGHSGLDAFSRWWLYGTLVSIGLGLDAQRRRERDPAPQPRPAPARAPRERRFLPPVSAPGLR